MPISTKTALPEPSKLVQTATLAKRLDVSNKTLKRWAKNHPDQITTFRPSSTVLLFDEDSVMTFLAHARVSAAADPAEGMKRRTV